jgi:cell division protein YceG involved in septum cleavage
MIIVGHQKRILHPDMFGPAGALVSFQNISRVKPGNTKMRAKCTMFEFLKQLLSPESQNKVQRYADWMEKNPATQFGHQINETSQADELRKTWAMKAKADKKFNFGKDPADWSENDARSYSLRDQLHKGKK